MSAKFNQIEWLKNMQRLRCLEETCADLHAQDKITGNMTFSIGEEAVTTGVVGLLDLHDNVSVIGKEYAFALLKGVSSKKIISEMFGRTNQGGEKHFFRDGTYICHGITKAIEMASHVKINNFDRRTICFFDQSSVEEAILHKSIKIAKNWNIPILFCCENSGSEDLFNDCNINVEVVDGMNIYDVVKKTSIALDYLKSEHKPLLLDFKTLRYLPNSKSENCPIELLKQDLKNQGLLSQIQWDHLKENISNELSEAVCFAEKYYF